MSNSKLVSYTRISPNNSGRRTHAIDRITPHCVVGQLSVETLGSLFARSSYQASCNYAIGSDGRVALIVDEGQRSWCSSSNANDQRAVTIECASDKTSPYAFNTTVYNKLIDLCVDICRRNGKTRLLWISDKAKALAYEPKSGEMLLTVHRWFANKACVPIDTEVLTKNGWVRIEDIEIGDEIACADIDNLRITFEEVYDKVPVRDQDTYTNNGFTATKDHRCVYRTQGQDFYRIDNYKNLLSNGTHVYIPLAGRADFDGFNITDDELRLLVAVQADGHYMHETWGGKDNTTGLEFHLKKERKIERAKMLLRNCHYEFSECRKSDGSVSIRVWGKDIVNRCETFLENKHFTWEWLNLSPAQAQVFLEEILFWDGCRAVNLYTSKENVNLDVVSAIAAINGVGSNVTGSNVQFRESPFVTLGREENSTRRHNKQHGSNITKVTCVSVKTGIFLIRQNGKTFITGNCPGEWMMDRMGDLAAKVTARLGTAAADPGQQDTVPHYYRVRKTWKDINSQVGAYSIYDNAKAKADEMGSAYAIYDWNGKEIYRKGQAATPAPTPAPAQVPYTQAFINEIAPLAQADMAKTGIPAALTIAQAILESGWGRSDLAKNAHNLFGMKKNLSGNTWPGSTWDGKRVCTKDTKEVYSTGAATVSAEFRVYNTYAESVGDHSAYLAGAKDGSALRYPGLVGCTDYRKAAQIVKDGKYATAPDYVDKICRIVEQYGLGKYNIGKNTEKPTQKEKEIRVFYPGYTRRYSPDDRQGAGCVWHDQDGHTLVIDAYEKNSPAAGKLIQYLVDNGLTKIDFVGTHAHCDHLGGGFKILEDDRITVENAYVYGPNTLKLAGDGTENGESVQEDKEYLQEFIDTAKRHGANVHIVDNGSAITCGEMVFEVYRDQPTHWSEYDTGEGWAYVNDGSLCLYSRQAYYMMSGDADASGMVQDHNLTVKGCEVGHHGNNGNRTSARIYIAHGCIWAVQCNNEAGNPGSCGFTQYGSGRMREAGVKVWQLTANIYGVIKSGKAVFTQGSTVIAWDCQFGKGDGGENPAVPHYYRVRKTWADSKSQKGAYSIYDNAKAKADEMGASYAVYDWNGKEIYRPGQAPAPAPEPAKPDVPFLVKVKTGMNIRKGPGTNYPAYRDCPVGVFTIVEVSGDGEWGRLKAGGWLYIAQPRWVERK